jgi:hypothetical protein
MFYICLSVCVLFLIPRHSWSGSQSIPMRPVGIHTVPNSRVGKKYSISSRDELQKLVAKGIVDRGRPLAGITNCNNLKHYVFCMYCIHSSTYYSLSLSLCVYHCLSYFLSLFQNFLNESEHVLVIFLL